ncbi:alpha-(1,3)-fucosyltransferase C-like [Palaemon carinicauda]|uniref:alpha-(1,3)-fucosyltransferase C-like n=1 Tax=Palaemon carinicauda TaxID=392227 RepID=UPI0035B62B66
MSRCGLLLPIASPFRTKLIPLVLLSFGFTMYYLQGTDKIYEFLKLSTKVLVPRNISLGSEKHFTAISAFPNETPKPVVSEVETTTKPKATTKPAVPEVETTTKPKATTKPAVPEVETTTKPKETTKPAVPEVETTTKPKATLKPAVPEVETTTKPKATTKPAVPEVETTTKPKATLKPAVLGVETTTKLKTTTPSIIEGKDPWAIESRKVPLRGLGDSLLPFQAEFAAQIKDSPKDLFQEKPPVNGDEDLKNPPLKKILFWNDSYGSKYFGLGYGREPFIRAKCPVNTCFTTSDRNRFKPEETDAVLWHFRAKDRTLPSKRSPHTRYVFWLMESASYLYGNINAYNHVFNWTFTYRLDSDFPNTYGVVYRRRTPLPVQDYQNITSGKTKLAAWFVSNCVSASKRERFVRELQKNITVDILGTCGPLKCSRAVQWDSCYKTLEKDYKFYFSFENSLCQDYVTEKFFNILKLNVVPVVYGFGNYSALAPAHSYINALDFPSAEDLAQYLLYLDKNDTAYNEYFRWKVYHHFPTDWDRRMNHWCELCKRLHTDLHPKTYDLQDWFVKKSHCRHSFQEGRDFHIKSDS